MLDPMAFMAWVRRLPWRAAMPAFLAFLLLGVSQAAWADSASAPAGMTAWDGGLKPAFALDGLDGRRVALAAEPGQVVLVHFFATWCEPCLVEVPALRRLVERSDPKELRILAISVGEVDLRVRNFADRMRVNFPVLLDRDRSVAKAWDIYSLPTTYVLGPDLKPRYVAEREYDWDALGVSDLRADHSNLVAPKQ